MKTVKIILLSAIAALSVYSCASDREDEVNKNPQNPSKIDLSKKTINKSETTSKIGDTINVNIPNTITVGSDGENTTNNDTGAQPIVDPTKPDKPW